MLDQNWYQQKIKGGLAESVCRAHFEALGYHVEAVGIEHIARHYCALSVAGGVGHYLQSHQDLLQVMPDFLISRTYADTHVNRRDKMVGRKEAVLVEVKFRKRFDPDLTEALYLKYQKLIESGLGIIVYLLVREPIMVKLIYFNHKLFPAKPHTNGAWIDAGSPFFASKPLYQGLDDERHFNWAYDHIVKPALEELFE